MSQSRQPAAKRASRGSGILPGSEQTRRQSGIADGGLLLRDSPLVSQDPLAPSNANRQSGREEIFVARSALRARVDGAGILPMYVDIVSHHFVGSGRFDRPPRRGRRKYIRIQRSRSGNSRFWEPRDRAPELAGQVVLIRRPTFKSSFYHAETFAVRWPIMSSDDLSLKPAVSTTSVSPSHLPTEYRFHAG